MTALDPIDRAIVNGLQGGFPISDRPYAEAAATLGLEEDVLIDRLDGLLERGVLSRFGPLYDIERCGGSFVLCALKVPEHDFERLAEVVNGFEQVAHNYQRDDPLNMWFVVAAESPEGADEAIAAIGEATGLEVQAFPKLDTFYIGFFVEV